ncbi:MAG: polysaccharide deacetylase family protein [Peptostreptococcaceae bacterium]|nr:polysaccharide deacetylase family protein [Peptostreptococcaceae bacterium]
MKKNHKLVWMLALSILLTTTNVFAEAKVINQGNQQIKEMALTFDDGYSVEKIRAIVSKLNQYNVKGTFFFVGSFMAAHKDIVREVEADGHMVVSHTFNHPDLTRMTDKGVVGEIENTKIAYEKATGTKILPYMRPPYGAYNDRVLNLLGKNHDLYVVMWTIDTLDWKKLPASTISNTVLSQAGNGKIVLMHTTQHVHTDEALDDIITGLHAKGYNLVRIDEMLAKLPESERIASISDNVEVDPSTIPPSTNEGQGEETTEPSDETEQQPEEQEQQPVVPPKKEKSKQLYRVLLSRK